MRNAQWLGIAKKITAMALMAAATTSMAQIPPDAGAVRQEVERQRDAAQPPAAAPPVTTTEPEQRASEGPTVKVTAFRFFGNTLLSEAQLNDAVESLINQTVDFSQLQRAADKVAEAYRKEGWIVRAYLPLQEIANGVVNIAVVEAIFGTTQLEGEPPTRNKFERLERYVAAYQRQGQPLDARALDRAVLLINDVPGISASANLRAGEKDRETDLLLTIKDESLLDGQVVVDNWGSRYTGEERATLALALNSPFKRGEQFTANALAAEGTQYVGVGGSMPLGSRGFVASVRGSYMDYELIADEFASLDATGSSTAFGAEGSYALLRSRSTNASVSLGYDRAEFDNEVLDTVTSRYSIDTLTLNLSSYQFDTLGGNGLNRASLTVTYGDADLSGSPHEAADLASVQVAGKFAKLRYFLSREQGLTSNVSVFASVTGQFTNDNLDSSQKFYVGGPYGVRAYQPSEAGGDVGHQVTVETRFRLPYGLNAAAFYDWGKVTINRNNDFPGAAEVNGYSVMGAGASLGWNSAFGLSIKATYVHRLGDPSTDRGGSIDSTLDTNRVLFHVGMSF
jgi:hemolysin activation/secretion protein